MEKFAVWKNHKVIGYVYLTEDQRQQMNSIPGIDVYFGYDKTIKPEMYKEEQNDYK